MIYWFFGYPGIGKDYCASHLARIGRFPHIDADDFLTDKDREKLLENTFTKEDRLLKLERIVAHLKILLKHHESVAVADSLADNTSREFVLSLFPQKIKLILVTAPDSLHKKRISRRKDHFFTAELLEKYLNKNWQKIKVPYVEFVNNASDEWYDNLKNLL